MDTNHTHFPAHCADYTTVAIISDVLPRWLYYQNWPFSNWFRPSSVMSHESSIQFANGAISEIQCPSWF